MGGCQSGTPGRYRDENQVSSIFGGHWLQGLVSRLQQGWVRGKADGVVDVGGPLCDKLDIKFVMILKDAWTGATIGVFKFEVR